MPRREAPGLPGAEEEPAALSPLRVFSQGDPSCVHHWVIGDPAGPRSIGECKKCGGRREFLNSIPREASTLTTSPKRPLFKEGARK